MSKSYIVAVYDVGQMYGGPEEGGWWYDVGSLVRVSRVFRNEDSAYAFCRRFNAKLNKLDDRTIDRELSAYVFEDVAPEGFPACRPRYE